VSGFFITGTDTGVGKTLVTGALMVALQQRGLTVAPMKPVAAGTVMVDGMAVNEDVALLQELSSHRFALPDVNPYCFAEPIAPHIAAGRDGTHANLDVIRAAFARLAAQSDVVLVEGAGGFLVPMSLTASMAEIPIDLALPVILVVAMRLGCINHALLTTEAIRARHLVLAGWVANTPGVQMAAYEANLATLERLLDAPLLGVIDQMATGNSLEASRLAGAHLDPGRLCMGV